MLNILWLQIWDLASGKLKLSLTGHISTVRGVIVSTRSPYLFSCGEDKQVKCWDLEYNKVGVEQRMENTASPCVSCLEFYSRKRFEFLSLFRL